MEAGLLAFAPAWLQVAERRISSNPSALGRPAVWSRINLRITPAFQGHLTAMGWDYRFMDEMMVDNVSNKQGTMPPCGPIFGSHGRPGHDQAVVEISVEFSTRLPHHAASGNSSLVTSSGLIQ